MMTATATATMPDGSTHDIPITLTVPTERTRTYRRKFYFIPQDDGYSALCATIPGCGTCGDTFEETKLRCREALQGIIESHLMHGEEIPNEPDATPEGSLTIDVGVTIKDSDIAMYVRQKWMEEMGGSPEEIAEYLDHANCPADLEQEMKNLKAMDAVKKLNAQRRERNP